MTLQGFQSAYVDVRQDGETTIARFRHNRLADDANTEQMGYDLFSLVEQFGCKRVVLSLEGVEYVNSAVIGKFITMHRKLHRDGGTLCLCALEPQMRDILHSSRLLNYFRVEPDLSTAVDAVK